MWASKVAILFGSIAIAVFVALAFLQNGGRGELDSPGTPSDAYYAAAGICEQGVEQVVRGLGLARGAATDGDVAWAFANEVYAVDLETIVGYSMREWRDAAHEGCLRGFRER